MLRMTRPDMRYLSATRFTSAGVTAWYCWYSFWKYPGSLWKPAPVASVKDLPRFDCRPLRKLSSRPAVDF